MTAPAATRSSFYAGMRVLPRAERHGMYAIYAFCRAVDDIADDQQTDRAARAAALVEWRRDVDALYTGQDAGRAAFLREPVDRFELARADFHAVIDGMATDVDHDVRWPPAAELDLYCDRVASAVGRLSVRVFGMEHQPGLDLSHHLGRALQLTNILRDVDEDAAIGRLYLPLEAIVAAGIGIGDVAAVVGDARIDAVCRTVADEAQHHFAAADAIMAARPQGHLISPRLMSAAYGDVLRRMMRVGWRPPRTRVRHNRLALAWTLMKLRLGA